MRAPAPRAPGPHVPVRIPDHRRRQREHRPHARNRRPARARAARGDLRTAGAEGARAGPARRLGAFRRAGPRLHGRRSLHRPQGPAPAGRPADLGPLRPRHRLPARGRFAGRARAEARVRLAYVQPDPPFLPRRPLLRRAVRVQGDTGRRRRAAAADGRGHRVVLRHRDARARRTRRTAHPRGAGGLGRRPRQHGPHRADGRRRPQGRLARRARRSPSARCRWTGSRGPSATTRATVRSVASPAASPVSWSVSASWAR